MVECKVSVIIPTYNRADTIMRAIGSALCQSFSDFELIIVDDCSTDNTKDIIQAIDDERVRYMFLEDNMGAGGARNMGATIARGEYLAFLDSDDEWYPNKLELQYKFMKEYLDYGMVYCKMHTISEYGEGEFPNSFVDGDLEGDIYAWLLCRNTIGTPTMFVRTELFKEIGGFDTSLRCLEDWEFAIRFAENYKIGYIDRALINIYRKTGGVSSNIGAYFETRCKMIERNKQMIQSLNLLDDMILEILTRAESFGVLSQVQDMIVQTLSV